MRNLLLVSLCLLTFACNSGGGGGGGNTPQGSPGPTIQPTPEPTPAPPDVFGETGAANFVVEAELPLGTNEGQFTGCDAQGNPTYVTDPKLKVGAKYDDLERTWVVNEGEGLLRLDSTITKVESKTIGRLLKVTESNVANIPVGAQANVTCTLDAQNQEQCTQAAQALAAARAGNLELYGNCYVDAQATPTYTRGKLTLASGKVVTAYRLRAVYAGNLNADCPVQGAGEETIALFQSVDVASPDFAYCGGTRMGFYRKISAQGETLRLDLSERRVAK